MSIVKFFSQTQRNNNIKPIGDETKNRNCHHEDNFYVLGGYSGTNKAYTYKKNEKR